MGPSGRLQQTLRLVVVLELGDVSAPDRPFLVQQPQEKAANVQVGRVPAPLTARQVPFLDSA
eukprot:1045173-Pyramimonas_sp.AAC.1